MAVPRLTRSPRHHHVIGCFVNARVPGLLPVDDPIITATDRARFHPSRIGSMLGLSDPKSETFSAQRQVIDPLFFLCLGPIFEHQQKPNIIAHDGVFVLEIVVQPKALARQVLTNDGHSQVRPVAPPVGLGEWISIMTRGIGPPSRFRQEGFPLFIGKTPSIPVGPRILTPVIKEANIVVLLLKRLDLGFNEGV